MDLNENLNANRISNRFLSKLESFLLLIFRNFDLLVNLLFIFSSFLIFINFFAIHLNSLFLLFPSLFLIYFAPGYQIFFKFFEAKYSFIEKLTLTVLVGIIFNILIGIFAGHLGILITDYFYLISILITFYFFMFLYKFSRKTTFFKKYNLENTRELIPKNLLLYIVFLLLFAIFSISRYPILFGDDSWFHLILTDEIIETGKIPFELYRGTNGLHLMGTVLHLFSGHPTIEIVRYFPIINFLISGLMGFVVFNKIFKNDQIGILGSFLLLISPFRFDIPQSQYVPTALGLVVFLFMMFFYIERIKNFTWEIKQTVKIFLFIGLGFLTLIFISDISVLIFLGLFVFISFFFTILDKKKIIDFGFFVFLFLIYGVYNIIGFQNIIFERFLVNISLPIYIYLILGAIGIFLIFLINKYSAEPKGKFVTWIKKKPSESSLKRMAVIYLKPILIILILVLPLIISFLLSIRYAIS